MSTLKNHTIHMHKIHIFLYIRGNDLTSTDQFYFLEEIYFHETKGLKYFKKNYVKKKRFNGYIFQNIKGKFSRNFYTISVFFFREM